MAYYAKVSDKKMQVLIEGQNRLRSQKETLVGEQLLDFVYYNLKKLNHTLDQAYSFATMLKTLILNGYLKSWICKTFTCVSL